MLFAASVNLALHKPAYQSSLYQPLSNHGPPELAVDGNKDLNWFHGSCTHTGQELYPWWAVDLQQTYHISKVKIYHRNDVVSGKFNFISAPQKCWVKISADILKSFSYFSQKIEIHIWRQFAWDVKIYFLK